MFWKTCGVSVNGASPSQEAPSPPIWVKPTVSRPIQVAMKWQPMPATVRLPSGERVLVLCGQPGQNQGSRTSAAGLPVVALRLASSSSALARMATSPLRSARRRAIARATMLASSAPWLGNSTAPCSSCLPTTRGRRSLA